MYDKANENRPPIMKISYAAKFQWYRDKRTKKTASTMANFYKFYRKFVVVVTASVRAHKSAASFDKSMS